VRKLRHRHGKYAPVVLDVIFDHVLCVHWPSFDFGNDRASFISWAYDVIDDGIESVPFHVARHLGHMRDYRWFDKYGTAEGITGILRGMDRRARFESHFDKALLDVADHVSLMIDTLGILLKDTQVHVGDLMKSL